MARLFFALWPDERARGELAALAGQAARRSGGRPVAAAKLHLTLVFLGDVETARIPELSRAANGVRGAAFDLSLDRLGAFARAGVAWAGCLRPPEELLALQAELERRVREAGFAPDARAFAAHLTLARHVREPLAPEGIVPVAWRVGSFALLESARGEGVYRTLAEWPLAGGKT